MDGSAPEPKRKARVSFEADQPGAVLESDATSEGKTAPWYVVCEAPCTRTLPIDGSYRVSGSGYHSSRPFRLPDDQSAVAVSAEMQDSSVAVPMALSIVGGVIASVGLLMIAGGVSREVDNRNGETLIISGAAVGGGGAIIGTIGVVMPLVKSQNTESKAHLTF
jgi:hypothetical protein